MIKRRVRGFMLEQLAERTLTGAHHEEIELRGDARDVIAFNFAIFQATAARAEIFHQTRLIDAVVNRAAGRVQRTVEFERLRLHTNVVVVPELTVGLVRPVVHP